MSGTTQQINGVDVFVCNAGGTLLAGEKDAVDLMGDVFASGAHVVAIPVGRLHPDFFVLSTRIAGLMLQKFVNYGFKVAIVGDVAAQAAKSKPLADFIRETNQGNSVWFVRDLQALEDRLSS